MGLIPAAWWPGAVQVSSNGKTLYMANANGRGAGPNNDFPPDNHGSPKASTMGTVNIVAVPSFGQLAKYTRRVLLNNGLIGSHSSPEVGPILSHGRLGSSPIKHVIFINKENATHDLLLATSLRPVKASLSTAIRITRWVSLPHPIITSWR